MTSWRGDVIDHPEMYEPSEIRLEGESLVAPHRPDSDFARVTGGAPVLAEFLALREGSGGDVLRYARAHGLLGLCDCGLPFGHETSCRPRRSDDGSSYAERVSDWLDIVRMAHAIVALTSELRDGPGSDEHWRTLNEPPRTDRLRSLWGVVGGWIEVADVRFYTGSPDGQPRLLGNWLFGVIALELLQAVKTQRLAVCSGCMRPYWRARATKRGQRNWCPRCREAGVRTTYAKRGGA